MKSYNNYINKLNENNKVSLDDILKGSEIRFVLLKNGIDDLVIYYYENEYVFSYSKKRQYVWIPNKYFYKYIFGRKDSDKKELFKILLNPNIIDVVVDAFDSSIKSFF